MQPETPDPTQNPTTPQPLEPTPTTPAPLPTPASVPTNQVSPSGMFVSSGAAPGSSTSQSLGGNTKRKIPAAVLVVGIVIVLLGGGAAAYFSTVVANKPENIWGKALTNTNKGYTKFVEYAKSNQNNKGLAVDGTFKADAASVVVDGTIKGKVYDKDADVTVDVGAAGSRVSLNILSHVPDSSTYPDVYIKASGLQGLSKLLGGSASEAGSVLAAFDNQWYTIDHTLFDQLQKQATTSAAATTPADFKPEDVYMILDSVGRVNADYLFTENKDKAVLHVTQNIGKETLDGRSTYHYKVGYNKDNLKKYVTALKDELNKTKVKDLVPDKNLEKAIDFENLLKDIDKLDGKGTADAWVDLDTKLIRKIRFTEENKPENYVDFILNYNGGDEYPFVVALHSKDGSDDVNFSVGVKLNIKNNAVDYTLDLKTTGTSPVTANASVKLTQSNEKIDFKKPEGAKSLSDLLGGLLGGQLQGAGGSSSLPNFDQLQL